MSVTTSKFPSGVTTVEFPSGVSVDFPKKLAKTIQFEGKEGQLLGTHKQAAWIVRAAQNSDVALGEFVQSVTGKERASLITIANALGNRNEAKRNDSMEGQRPSNPQRHALRRMRKQLLDAAALDQFDTEELMSILEPRDKRAYSEAISFLGDIIREKGLNAAPSESDEVDLVTDEEIENGPF